MHICNLSTGKLEARRSGKQGQPCLYSKFEANLGYMRPSGKTKGEGKKRKKASEFNVGLQCTEWNAGVSVGGGSPQNHRVHVALGSLWVLVSMAHSGARRYLSVIHTRVT